MVEFQLKQSIISKNINHLSSSFANSVSRSLSQDFVDLVPLTLAVATFPIVCCVDPANVTSDDFPTDPTFQACFFISKAMFNTLPKGQDKIQSSLTFKGDYRIGYTVTLYKLGK